MIIKTSKHIIKTASSLVLLAVLFFQYSCTSNKPEEINAIPEAENTPSIEVEDYNVSIIDSGRIKYRITTPHMLDYDKLENPYREFPEGGHIITYDSINVIKSEIKCHYAINHYKDKLWDLRKNVEAVNEEGVVFNTEQLYWDEKEKKIYTDKFIKITEKNKVITGIGMESTQNMKKYQIKNLTGEFDVDDKMQE